LRGFARATCCWVGAVVGAVGGAGGCVGRSHVCG